MHDIKQTISLLDGDIKKKQQQQQQQQKQNKKQLSNCTTCIAVNL